MNAVSIIFMTFLAVSVAITAVISICGVVAAFKQSKLMGFVILCSPPAAFGLGLAITIGHFQNKKGE